MTWPLVQLRRMARIRNGADHKDVVEPDGAFPVYGSGGEFARAGRHLYEGPAVLLGRKGTIDRPLLVEGKYWTVDTMFCAQPEPTTDARFLYYACTTIPFSLLSTSTALPSMTQADLNAVRLPRPPLEDQVLVADFLDRETAKIDSLITKQEQLIATLREDRTATITHAVTKGIDPDVLLKDSGVEWLGEVARHWVVSRFSRHVAINGGQVDPRLPQYAAMPLIAPNHIESGTGRLLLLETAAEQGADSGKYLVSEGQVIYSKIRPNLAKVVIAPCDTLCSADMYGLLPDSRITTGFLFYLLLSKPFTDYVIESSMRVAMPKVNHESLGGAPLWMPPISEQRDICAYLDDRLGSIDRLMAKAAEVVDCLQEYRSALITDAVTGKIDVRGAA